MYNFDTVLYQFLVTGTSGKCFICIVSQVSAYTPFHFFFTVPLNKGLNEYGCKPGIVILVTWNYANSPFNIWSPFTCACKTCENTGNWFVCLCTASWHLIKYSSNFQTLKILFELSNAQLELKISLSVCKILSMIDIRMCMIYIFIYHYVRIG